jgi:hypothetical protein
MIHVWISCDLCNPEGRNASATRGRGVVECGENVLDKFDWEIIADEHICNECIAEARTPNDEN